MDPNSGEKGGPEKDWDEPSGNDEPSGSNEEEPTLFEEDGSGRPARWVSTGTGSGGWNSPVGELLEGTSDEPTASTSGTRIKQQSISSDLSRDELLKGASEDSDADSITSETCNEVVRGLVAHYTSPVSRPSTVMSEDIIGDFDMSDEDESETEGSEESSRSSSVPDTDLIVERREREFTPSPVYFPDYSRRPHWRLGEEQVLHNGTWEELMPRDWSRPATPSFFVRGMPRDTANEDDGFVEAVSESHNSNFNNGDWSYGVRLAVVEMRKEYFLYCGSRHRRPLGSARPHDWEAAAFLCAEAGYIRVHYSGRLAKIIKLNKGLNYLVWCVSDIVFSHRGAYDMTQQHGEVGSGLSFEAAHGTKWSYEVPYTWNPRFPYSNNDYTFPFYLSDPPGCTIIIHPDNCPPTLQQLLRAQVGEKQLSRWLNTNYLSELAKEPWNEVLLRTTYLELSLRRIRRAGRARDQGHLTT